MKKKTTVVWWGLKLAWSIDKKMILFWCSLSAIVSAFPALILANYENTLSVLSSFLATGKGTFGEISVYVVLLGVFIIIYGFSARLNQDFLYMTMYDSYYLGYSEVLMDVSQSLSLSELVKKKTKDEFDAAFRRTGALNDLTSAGCALFGSMISILSILFIACKTSWLIGLLALGYVVLVLWANIRLSEKCRVVWKDLDALLRKSDYIRSLVQEGDTAKEIRIFRNLEHLKQDWRRTVNESDQMNLRRAKGFVQINTICQCGFYLFLGLIMIFALLRVSNGSLKADSLLMLFTLGINLSEAVVKVPPCYQRFDYGVYGLGLLKEFLKAAPLLDASEEQKKVDTPADENICFKADHLSFAYPGGDPVLKDVSFEIKTGETVALVGVNGSGKSTLLNLLMGIYKAEPGTLMFQGRNYDEYRHNYFTQKIGTFFQDFFVFHLTVKENVGIGNPAEAENNEAIWAALYKGGAANLVATWDKGINQRLNKEIYTDGKVLSGGETQRMAVARTHMSDKEILIFDEPASMLDPIAELEQFNHIKNKIKGHTAILVSHRIGFARLADRIIVLDEGKVAEIGTHEHLMQNNGVYARLFHEQAQWYDLNAAKEVK